MVKESLPDLAAHTAPYPDALDQLNDYLQDSDDLSGYLQLLFDLVLQNTGADYGYLLLPNAGDSAFQIIIAQDSDGKPLPGKLDMAIQILNNLAIERRESIRVTKASGDPHLAGLADGAGIATAYLIVPMILASRVAGLICLVSHSAGQFEDDQQGFTELLSVSAALVIEKDQQAQNYRRAEERHSEFISLTTHELRVPLTAMAGYTDMILNGMAGPISERQELFLRTIRRNVDRMRILIDSLGEMNRIDAGRRRFDLKTVDLTEIVETAILALEEDIAERQQELVVDIDPALPFVRADRLAVLAVLKALIDNASRYSGHEAIISLHLSLSTDKARLAVVDTGVGINLQDQSRLFTPFYRSDDPAIRDHIGWGLALAHSKKVIEALGGTIGFESTLGKGSSFYFTIPIAAPETISK